MSPLEIDYGQGPQANEIEITLFGPGYGEAIALHVGSHRWVLVDSCLVPGTTSPAAADYLSRIGVSHSEVKALVVSHWHDDHVRGVSQLANLYPSAKLFVPGVFTEKEALVFASAYSGEFSSGLSRGTRELYESLASRESYVAVKSRVEILDHQDGIPAVRIVAFSPTDAAVAQFLAHIFEYIPRTGSSLPIGHAPELSPNVSSIVLHVSLGTDAILLGADLERHATAGWEAIIDDDWCCSKARASVIKLAHHGSASGDHPAILDRLTIKEPLALLSPFNNGRHQLPTPQDRTRILSRSADSFITSLSSAKAQLPADQLKRLRDMCTRIAPSNSGFGAVRARRRATSNEWNVEVFGSAGRLVQRKRAA
jgi:beta-lactamase superfamily II metal-dependent hydrolase